jgi:hypothetical protein
MASQQGITAGKLLLAGSGALLLWSGLTGKKWTAALKDIIAGKSPLNVGKNDITTGLPASTLGGITSTNPITGDTGPVSASAAHNQAIAKLLAAPYGWSTGSNWDSLVALWTRESGWSSTALNASSGATGIPQLLPSAHVIPPGWSNPSVQIAWGLAYIAATYGDPDTAWAHEESQGWY